MPVTSTTSPTGSMSGCSPAGSRLRPNQSFDVGRTRVSPPGPTSRSVASRGSRNHWGRVPAPIDIAVAPDQSGLDRDRHSREAGQPDSRAAGPVRDADVGRQWRAVEVVDRDPWLAVPAGAGDPAAGQRPLGESGRPRTSHSRRPTPGRRGRTAQSRGAGVARACVESSLTRGRERTRSPSSARVVTTRPANDWPASRSGARGRRRRGRGRRFARRSERRMATPKRSRWGR